MEVSFYVSYNQNISIQQSLNIEYHKELERQLGGLLEFLLKDQKICTSNSFSFLNFLKLKKPNISSSYTGKIKFEIFDIYTKQDNSKNRQ